MIVFKSGNAIAEGNVMTAGILSCEEGILKIY